MERLQIRSEEVDATAESKSLLQAVGAKPPQGNISTTSMNINAIAAEQPDMRPIGAQPPEHPSTSEVPEAQLGASALPSTSKKTTPQQMIYRYKKQSQPAFLHMCRSVPSNLPYYAVHEHADILNAKTSQDIRHLALIDMKVCT